MKILLVDDDDLSLDLLENALVSNGYDVTMAHDGTEALDVLKKGEHRLVISDWEMPKMDGLELCRRVREECLHGYVYVILLTSHSQTDDIVTGLSAGADDFVSKPFEPAELIVRVRTGERVVGLETRDLTIFALARLAESRDPETGAHLERVRNYSFELTRVLAEHADFSSTIDRRYCQDIYSTSPLHDIGKIGIPDFVLLKPGRLDDREFEIMKTHASIGAQTLDAALTHHPNAQFLVMARDIAAAHHEWFDGSGYPEGMNENDIPLCARIVALADVYDALTSKRVYKEEFSHDVAKSILVEESGSHFDPRIVEAFLRVEAEFVDISVRFKEASLATS